MVAVKYWSLTTANSVAKLRFAALVFFATQLGWAMEPRQQDQQTDQQGAVAQLAQQLSGLRSYAADFTQVVLGGRNEVLQQSSGRVHIARPDRFKWVVSQPYPQTLVTVADKLYLFDPDLQQLTIESLTEAMAGTPALILTGNSDQIDELFRVVSLSAPSGTSAAVGSVFSLYPKDESALFAEIRMRFDGQQQLTDLDIIDHLGQLTQVTFANISYNAKLAGDEFEFTVPPGTDVIGDLP